MSKEASKAIIGTARPPFLVLPPACVLLGYAAAVWTGAEISYLHLFLAFLGAVTAHISVNALNEYFDFKSGLDLNTERTPFSGGSGTLPGVPEKSHLALVQGVVTFVITALIGIYFMAVWGWAILPLGAAGLITIALYTTHFTKNPFLCLLAPGLGFGTFMVMGTAFVLTGEYSMTAFVASMVPFFLVSNLLLLNQFPDVEADKEIGRYHLLIARGKKTGVRVYTAFMVGAYASVIYGYIAGLFPLTGLLALLSLALAVPTIKGVMRHSEETPALIPFMGKNVAITVFTPVLLAVGIFAGKLMG